MHKTRISLDTGNFVDEKKAITKDLCIQFKQIEMFWWTGEFWIFDTVTNCFNVFYTVFLSARFARFKVKRQQYIMLHQKYIACQRVNLRFFWKKVCFAKWNDVKCRRQRPQLWIWKPYCSLKKTGGITEKAEQWFLEFWDWITFCNWILCAAAKRVSLIKTEGREEERHCMLLWKRHSQLKKEKKN